MFKHVSVCARRIGPFLARLTARKLLIIQVQVGRAALLSFKSGLRITTAMFRADRMCTFSGDIYVCVSMCVIRNEIALLPNILGVTVSASFVILEHRVLVGEIDLHTDFITCLVALLTVFVEASGSATELQQCLIAWLFQEHIHIALNLLGGRPIDLAVLLETLLGLVGSLPFVFTATPATVVDILTDFVHTFLPCTICCFTFCLLAITFRILCDVCFV